MSRAWLRVKGDSEKQKIASRFRTLILCVQEAQGTGVRKHQKTAIKIQFHYKTKSKAKTVFQSQGVQKEGFPRRRALSWSFRQDSKAHTGNRKGGGSVEELSRCRRRVISMLDG